MHFYVLCSFSIKASHQRLFRIRKKTKVLYFYELMKYPQKRKKVFTAGAKISMTFQLGAHMLTGGKYPNEQNFFGKGKTQLLNIRLSIGKFSAEYNINGRIGETDN